jgi:ABC-2 type transport system ATP-binding protein
VLVVDLERPAPPLEIEGARVERVDGPRQWLRFRGSAADLTARVARAARLVDLQVTEPDIEEIVRRIYRGEKTPEPRSLREPGSM